MGHRRCSIYAMEPKILYGNVSQQLRENMTDLRNVFSVLAECEEYQLSREIGIYGYPVLILIGTIGNFLSFLVTTRITMKTFSTCFYMAVLSVGDTLVLYIGCFRRWLTYVAGLDVLALHPVTCKLFNVFHYWAFNMSVWTLVAMTVDRFIIVHWPLKALTHARVSKAKVITVLVAVVHFPINAHFFWTVTISKRGTCIASKGYEEFVETIWPWIDAMVYAFIPLVLISLFNTAIIYDNRKAMKQQVIMTMGTGVASNHKLTPMLVTVSVAFLLFSMPKAIFLVIRNHVFSFVNESEDSFSDLSRQFLVSAIMNFLTYGNHAINFFLYCITGEKFRQELMHIICCQKIKRRRSSTVSMLTSHV